MDCLLHRRASGEYGGPSGIEVTPSPVLHRRIDILLENSLEKRLAALEPQLTTRVQKACMTALIPELLSRVEHACHEIVKSLEPELTWRVQLSLSSKLRTEMHEHQRKADEMRSPPKANGIGEPAPEPTNTGSASLTNEILTSKSFQHFVSSAIEQSTGEQLRKLESEVCELSSRMSQSSMTLAKQQYDVWYLLDAHAKVAVAQQHEARTPTPVLEFPEIPAIDHDFMYPSPEDIVKPVPVTPTPPPLQPEGSPKDFSHLYEAPEAPLDHPPVLEQENGVVANTLRAGEQENVLDRRENKHMEKRVSGITRQSTADHFQRELVQHADAYKLEESVWEMVVVVGTGWTSPSGDIQLAIAFLVNLVMQVMLGIIFFLLFSDTTSFDIDVESLRKWRVTAAHDFHQVDSIAQETLVSRICRNDGTLGIYTNYVEMLQDIDVYNEAMWPSTVGLLLCSIVVLIWVFTVVDDVLDCIGFLHGLACVPRGLRTKITAANLDEDSLELHFKQISLHRLLFITVACGARIVIALCFLLVGCEWLAHTYEFTDLLLNSVALAFVFHLDELCFEILVPIDVITVCDILKPLPLEIHKIKCLKRCPSVNSSDVSRIPLLFSAIIFFIYICIAHIKPRTTMLEDAEEALCGGKLNFATGYDARTKLLFTAPTNAGDKEDLWPSGIPTEIPIIRSLTDDRNYLNVRGVAHMAGVDDLRQNVEMKIHTMVAEIYHTCKDVNFDDGPTYMLPTIQRHNSNPSATTCDGLKADCLQLDQLLLRMNCPVACGAASPRSGLFLDRPPRGIPRSVCHATQQYQDELAQIECRDLSQQELAQQPGWMPGWSLMLSFWKDRSTAQRKDCFDTVAGLFKNEGCGAVAKLPTLACLGADYSSFCIGSDDVLNVAMFCPISCGCQANPSTACPTQCNAGNTTR